MKEVQKLPSVFGPGRVLTITQHLWKKMLATASSFNRGLIRESILLSMAQQTGQLLMLEPIRSAVGIMLRERMMALQYGFMWMVYRKQRRQKQLLFPVMPTISILVLKVRYFLSTASWMMSVSKIVLFLLLKSATSTKIRGLAILGRYGG